MSIIQKVIKAMPAILQKPALKALYLKNGHKMKSVRNYNDRFFVYEVDNNFVGSETLGWFVTYDYYKDWVDNLSAFAYTPKPGDVILDIGAGLGEEGIVFSKLVGATGKVFCIEANPQVFTVLQDIVALNNLNNVKLLNEAINVENGPTNFSVASNSFIGGGIGSNIEGNTEFEVAGVRMDSLLKRENIDRVDFLKVNIEGAERFVIASLGSSIGTIKHVAISCHDFRYRYDGNEFFRTRELVETYLRDNNFEIVSDNGDRKFEDWVYASNRANQNDVCVV